MTRAATSPKRARPASNTRARSTSGLDRYLAQSQTPLTTLLFVLPLLILHEIGITWYGTASGGLVEHRITAFALLMRLFHTFGASGRYLPALAVVAVLLSWHIARRDGWVFNIPALPVMALESLAWALPLLGVYFLFAEQGRIYAPVGQWKLMASLYLGAGVYEELVFRLGAFSVLSFLLMDLAGIGVKRATPVIVVIAAIAFSGYHLWGSDRIPWQAFVFIGLRGVFYGIIFVERGFGITVGAHTAYDLLFLALREAAHG